MALSLISKILFKQSVQALDKDHMSSFGMEGEREKRSAESQAPEIYSLPRDYILLQQGFLAPAVSGLNADIYSIKTFFCDFQENLV